jgi:predicted nucleic acid-binding protein
MYYLDTSVLLAFTLLKSLEPDRFAATSKVFQMFETRHIKAVTSFYALHELLIIAVINTDPDWQIGSQIAREAFQTIFKTNLLYLPIPRREDKVIKSRLFHNLRDSTDLPHAVAAHSAGCHTIIAYDEHFRAINDIITYQTPEEILAKFGENESSAKIQ